MISVRQTRDLPRASFRFRIATDTLAFSYVLTANGSHSGLSPVRVRPCWANKKRVNDKRYSFVKITGVAGFEPTREGVKVPCLTAWLYPKKKRRLMGFEPTNAGTTIRCVNPFATIAMAGTVGIEPTLAVLETAVLPLNYVPILNFKKWRRVDSNH